MNYAPTIIGVINFDVISFNLYKLYVIPVLQNNVISIQITNYYNGEKNENENNNYRTLNDSINRAC